MAVFFENKAKKPFFIISATQYYLGTNLILPFSKIYGNFSPPIAQNNQIRLKFV
jgi:hypothetical protein